MNSEDFGEEMATEPCTDLTPTVIEEETLPIVSACRRHIDIDTNIGCIADLLRIIDLYDPEVDYNIDLAAMHSIRDELTQINDMVGMHSFKESLVDQLLYFTQGLYLNSDSDYKHMVIYGPPGTGKTQLAKLVGKMYSKLGIIGNNECRGDMEKGTEKGTEKEYVFRKVTRTDLVAGYMGQTAIKTKKVIEECLGGCLFIDEVYSLGTGTGTNGISTSGSDSYSRECIDTLCEALSDYKDDLMVIVAGYKDQVRESFFGSNPGLESRFIWQFSIEDYTSDELKQIFCKKVEQNGWKWTSTNTDASEQMTAWMESKKGQFTYFGRDMDLLFTHTKIAHGRRIYGQPMDQKKHLTMEDVEQGYKLFIKHKSASGTAGEQDRSAANSVPFGMYI